MTLDQLAIKHRTDKASDHHNYCVIYEQYLEALRDKKITLIELGTGGYQYEDRGGESLRMWYDYFPHGKIVGVDLHNKINIVNDRTEFWQGSQTDANLLQSIIDREKYVEKRIVIDDASHNNGLTVKTFQIVFPLLQPGDLYIVEDVHTSYFQDSEFEGSKDPSAKITSMHYFSQLTHQLNYQHLEAKYHNEFSGKIDFIHFYKQVIIIKKK